MILPELLPALLIGLTALMLFLSGAGWIGNRIHGAWGALIPLTVVLLLTFAAPEILTLKTLQGSFTWSDSLQTEFGWLLDGLSWFFMILIAGIGILIYIYASGYLEKSEQSRFYPILTFFMFSMLGLVWFSNLILIYICWELTSISSFLLIGFKNKDEKARASALQALIVTGLGGLALLGGLLILGTWQQTFDLYEILQKPVDHSDPRFYWSFSLILLGAITKSAQVPFHFWLPDAMAAPTPVSAYLHSSTMVKAGIYLLARVSPVFGDSLVWYYVVTGFGMITLVWASLKALSAADLKRKLAFLTVAALALMVMVLGSGGEAASHALLWFIIAHALYKVALFMVAGNIDHEAGTRNILQLNGLARKLPVNFSSTILAVISLASIPPLFGFIGKEALVNTMLEDRPLSEVGLAALIIGASVFVYVSLEFVLKPFTGKPVEPADKSISEHHFSIHWTPILPGLVALFLGLYPSVLDKLSGAFGLAVSGSGEIPHLKLWHGFNTEVVVSLVTLILGSVVYWWAGRNNFFYKRTVPEIRTVYQLSRPLLRLLAARVTRTLQYGIMRNYLAIIVTGWMLLMVVGLSIGPVPGLPDFKFNPGPYELMVVLVMMVIVGLLFRLDSRLSIIVFMSFSGFLVAMVFGLFSAPDLSITQLLVETLMLSIFLLLLHRMPGYRIYEPKFKSWLFLPVAVVFGFGISGLLWWLYSFKKESMLKSFYLEQSKPLGKGENVVNVILVDFRAFDTMGEVTVLGIAAIGVYALLKNK